MTSATSAASPATARTSSATDGRRPLRIESLERDFDAGPNYTVNAATIDLAFTPTPQFRLLMEARVDDADEDIYLDSRRTGSMTGTQPTLGVKAIYAFGS